MKRKHMIVILRVARVLFYVVTLLSTLFVVAMAYSARAYLVLALFLFLTVVLIAGMIGAIKGDDTE